MDLGCFGFAAAAFFTGFFTGLAASGFLVRLALGTGAAFAMAASLGFLAASAAFLEGLGAGLALSFLPASDSLYEALTLVSFPLEAEFFSWSARVFLKLDGSTALCLSSMYLAIAYGLDPLFSFSARIASLIICSNNKEKPAPVTSRTLCADTNRSSRAVNTWK